MLIFLPGPVLIAYELLFIITYYWTYAVKTIKYIFLNIQEKKCPEYVKFVVKKHLLEIT